MIREQSDVSPFSKEDLARPGTGRGRVRAPRVSVRLKIAESKQPGMIRAHQNTERDPVTQVRRRVELRGESFTSSLDPNSDRELIV